MNWKSPVLASLVPSTDADSYKNMSACQTGLPLAPHPGAFGVQRKNHVHEGIDLYMPEGSPVFAVEAGKVIDVRMFTGPDLGHEWWLPTHAVWVEGASGVVVYGEIKPAVTAGKVIFAGELIGHVTRVLKTDKGRPTCMLHLELRESGNTEDIEWLSLSQRPGALKDPTPYLLDCAGLN